MRQLVFLAIVALFIAGAVSQFADRIGMPDAGTMSPVKEADAAPQPPSTVMINRDERGHFQVDGRIDGRLLGFMVDTGATVVALRQGDAERVGIRPSQSDFTAEVKTANGIVHGARTQLSMVEVGGLIVRDVQAVVLPDAALSENLLGLSFLSRLRRFEFNNGRLVLEQ